MADSTSGLPREGDRVRRHTRHRINELISRQTRLNVSLYASRGPDAIRERIKDLDGEWDVERALEVIAPSLSLAGLLLGLARSRKWFLLPMGVLGFFIQHAVQGWCPPLPVLRKFGFRTRSEIDEEKYMLKAIRGDFAHLSTHQLGRAEQDI